MEGIQKRYLSCQKWYIKGKGVLPQGGASEYNPLFSNTLRPLSDFTIYINIFYDFHDSRLTLLWYHAVIRPFVALDEGNNEEGLCVSMCQYDTIT